MISDKQILSHIARQPRGTAGYKQLLRELGLRGDERRQLEEHLRALKRAGQIREVGRDRFVIATPGQDAPKKKDREKDLVAGRLSMHRDGFGFVTPEDETLRKKIDGDIFIPPPAVGLAMHGDRVFVELTQPPRDGGRAEGRIAQIASRAHSTVVGTFHYGAKSNYVRPFDEKIGQDVVIPSGLESPGAGFEDDAEEDAGASANEAGAEARVLPGHSLLPPPQEEPRRKSKAARMAQSPHRVIGAEAQRKDFSDMEGVVVDVEITQWPTPTQPPRGRVIEILGYEDDFGVDVEIIIRKHHLPHIFPPAVLEEAQREPAVIAQRELRHRQDHRELPIVTIDGETARDFDDAVLARELPNGNLELQVHIADVAHYVREGSAIDQEARLRGTSVYFPDRAVPMLPLELSTDICSLRPNVERLVMSCIMELDRAGEVVGYAISEGVIRSAARMTYTDVQLILDGDEQARRKYAAPAPNLELMREVAEILNRKRVRRGSIDFDLPEPVIEFDDRGLMRGITRSERKFSNRLIEEFMLAANECVASFLEQKKIASIYRIHEKPDAKKVHDFEALAAGFGYSLGVGALPIQRVQLHGDRRHQQGSGRGPRTVEIPQEVHLTPRMYQKLTQKIAGTPEERIVSYLMLRSLKQARYSEVNEGHFALAAPTYTHFTSPIRRYPDLIIHRILKEVLHQGEGAEMSGTAAHSEAPSPWSKRHQGDDRHAGRRRSKHQEQIAEQRRVELAGPVAEPVLHDIAEESSFSERRADDAERELMEWKKIRFMRERIGEDFDALITSVTKHGLFVELMDMFIEGLVPLNSFLEDRFTYRENTRQLIGEETRKAYSIGDRVRVVLDRIDQVQRKLQFAVIEERPPRRPQIEKKEKKARAKKEKRERKGKKGRR